MSQLLCCPLIPISCSSSSIVSLPVLFLPFAWALESPSSALEGDMCGTTIGTSASPISTWGNGISCWDIGWVDVEGGFGCKGDGSEAEWGMCPLFLLRDARTDVEADGMAMRTPTRRVGGSVPCDKTRLLRDGFKLRSVTFSALRLGAGEGGG